MKNNQAEHIEKRLSDASKQMIPGDMYNRIAQSIVQGERTIRMNKTITVANNTKRRTTRWIAAAAAACLLLVCGIFGGNYYLKNLTVDSIVNIDVNPGIEISTNKNDVVLDVTAINSDAQKVLDGMNLKNTDLKSAVNAIVGSMVKNGYLIDGESSILVTVQNKDENRATHIRNLILTDINSSLKDNNITASVVNQTVTDNTDAREFASAQGISFGKATLIINLCTKDDSLNRETLAKMNIREIAALVVEKDIDISDIVDYDADDSIWENIEDAVEDANEEDEANQSTTAVSASEAKVIALAHAGITASDVSYIHVELDTDDGVTVYEIDFTAGTTEYDYKIDAETGEVIKSSSEPVEIDDPGESTPDATEPPQGPMITADEAKEIALTHAGIAPSDVSFLRADLDKDDGVDEYEIDFTSGTMEYDYKIDAYTGAVLKSSQESIEDDDTDDIIKDTTQSPQETAITAAMAKEIALNHAGISADAATFIKVELDTDDGIQVYDVEFCADVTEYDYEIDATTGRVIDYESEDYD